MLHALLCCTLILVAEHPLVDLIRKSLIGWCCHKTKGHRGGGMVSSDLVVQPREILYPGAMEVEGGEVSGRSGKEEENSTGRDTTNR